MKRIIEWLFLCLFLVVGILVGCGQLNQMDDLATMPEPIVVRNGETVADDEIVNEGASGSEGDSESEEESIQQTEELVIELTPERIPVKVKGIYVSAYVAGTSSKMDAIIDEINKTELNAVVIDVKDDYGRITCEMNSELIEEIGSVQVHIPQAKELIQRLHELGIYTIARIPAFRDSWIGDMRPEWCVKRSDGTVFHDRDGNAWVNPYKEEAWDYLVEIALQAKKLGFDEVQFDYLRFCTEKGLQDAVFDEAEVKGRSRTDIILECMEYLYERLRAAGLFVSADVFGAIINSDINADSVGQIYGELAKHLDYISPMIYPSHYEDGNYGIDHPDIHPYETVKAALLDSRKELEETGSGGIAIVRPWLQGFTATWLPTHLTYGEEEIRQQIQATYDAGYDEWIFWDASCNYAWEGLLDTEEAQVINQPSVLSPETTWEQEMGETAASDAALQKDLTVKSESEIRILGDEESIPEEMTGAKGKSPR